MFRRPRSSAAPDAAERPVDDAPRAPDDATDEPARAGSPDLSGLPIAGITRRRAAGVIGGLIAAWIVIVFVRQVGEASAATARADDITLANVTLRLEVAALERELELIGRQRYIEQQARGYGLGSPREVAFTLSPSASALPDDAPGSASVRLGARTDAVSPLESWLTVLFGPSD